MSDQFFAFESTGGSKFFVWSKWKEGVGFELNLFAGMRTWKGKVSMQSLEDMAESADVERDEFVKLAKHALTGRTESNGQKTVFKYDVEIGIGEVKLTWKKQINEKTNFKLGSIELRELEDNNGDLLDSMLEHIGERFASLSTRVHNLQNDNARLSEEHTKATEALNEAVYAKADVEERLLGSFVDVLNTKKRKIVDLTKEVDRLQEQIRAGQEAESMDVDDQEQEEEPETTADVAPKEPTTSTRLSKKSVAARSKRLDDENGEDTDEEKDQYERSRRNDKSKGPSLDDADLILTHGGDHRTSTTGIDEESKDLEEEANDDGELFVPKKRQRKTARGGKSKQSQAPSTSGTGSRTRQSKASTPQSSQDKSIDLDSPRQTRSSTTGSSSISNLLSKLS